MKKKNLKIGKRAPELKRGKPVRVQRLLSLRARVISKALAWYNSNLENGWDGKLWPESWQDERQLHKACKQLAQANEKGQR